MNGEMLGASKAYSNMTKIILSWLQELTGEEYKAAGMRPKERFLDTLQALKSEIELQTAAKGDLTALNDIVGPLKTATSEEEIQRIIESAIGKSIDDFTPNQIFNAFEAAAIDAAQDGETIDLPATEFLRNAISKLFQSTNTKGRFNIGSNRHWPRLWQWLSEYSETTDFGDGIGLKILNASRAGRVAEFPAEPALLIVRVDKNWL